MSGENEVGTPGSSSAHTSATSGKSDASESECNAENLLTSNYPGSGGSDVDIKPTFGSATFQSSHGAAGVVGAVGSGVIGGASDLASLIDNKNGKMVLVRPNIPLIANSATENNNKMINNNNNNNNNNNLSTPNKKLFECDVCNMKFSNGANMRRHKMRHTGVKPYECRVCQKRFFRKDHLSEHFTTHIKTLPFHCPICNRGFQRQIAMRAHFQNEHVGQHDLVKTCPLCNYRAGTMKSLRVHFFNRHGIDLDNPGTNASSSLLLALEQSNLPHLMQQAGLAAAAAAFNEAASGPVDASSRSQDNLTPPMHYLTPHVEISMADNNEPVQIGSPSHSSGGTATSLASGLDIQAIVRPKSNPTSSASETSVGGSSSAKNLSNAVAAAAAAASRQMYDSTITPSISLIPIKQEPNANDDNMELKSTHSSLDRSSPAHDQNSLDGHSPSTSSLTSLIKVSPLKSLLREDLKRRISARAIRSRVSSNIPSALSISMGGGSSINSSAAESSLVLSPGSTSGGGISNSPNGIITSTGETELIITGRKLNLKCLFCNIEFPDQTLYFLHKGCHSESNAWKCNICGEQLQNVYEFNSHLLSKSHQ